MSRGKEVGYNVKWNTHKVFVGDICYALDRKIYRDVWVNDMNCEEGLVGNYAVVADTEYGDGCYDGKETAYCVDAGVIGVTDIEHYLDSRHSIEDLKELGSVVEIPSGKCEICFDADVDGTFYITINDLGSNKTVFNDVIYTNEEAVYDDDEEYNEDDYDDYDDFNDDEEAEN